MNKLEKVEKKLNKVEKKFDDSTLAMEMLREMKESNKRKDKIYCTIILFLIAVIALLVGFYFWHENQFETVIETEETTVNGGNGVATYLENSESGDINYGENN